MTGTEFPFHSGNESGSLNLGPLRFHCFGAPGAGNRFIWVHGDETTAGDILHLLANNGERCYAIDNDRRNFTVDAIQFNPNRIFTEIGARKDLQQLNPAATPEALKPILRDLDRDRSSFLENIFPPDGGVLTALHNNFESYTIASELDRSAQVHFPEKDRPRDFFLAVDADDYRRLSQGPFNVLLQDQPGIDDGSLSCAALAAGVRYVNIETELGMRERQQSMVDWLIQALIDGP
ncbi:MAG: hypothetical protein ACE5D1_05725 [Fidelibacterota bacterium]